MRDFDSLMATLTSIFKKKKKTLSTRYSTQNKIPSTKVRKEEECGMERRGRRRESASSRPAWKPAATAKSWSRGGTSSEKVQNAAVNDPCDVPAIVGTCTLMCPGQPP